MSESLGATAIIGDTVHYVGQSGTEYVFQGTLAGAGSGTAGEMIGSIGVVGDTFHYVGKTGKEYVYQGTVI